MAGLKACTTYVELRYAERRAVRRHDGPLDGTLKLRHPRVRQSIGAVDAIGSIRTVGEERAHILPHDLAGRRNLEHSPVRALRDERVAVDEPLRRADVVAEESIALRAANRILPDLLQRHRIDLEHTRAAAADDADAVG